MILIITNKEDAHPTPVIKSFNESQISIFRLNTDTLLTDYEFSWWCNEMETDFHIRNVINGLEIKGSEIHSVWDRRPMPPSFFKT